MSTLTRISFKKLIVKSAPKAVCVGYNLNPIRGITTDYADLPPKPKPWNYKEKTFNIFHHLYDKTSSRLDENSKVIVVEGPLAAGKSKLAKEIAKSFGMLYLPEANLDMHYINSYGYDLRKLDPMLPPDGRSFDVMDFMRNPKHKHSAKMQIDQYLIKFSQYIDALAHLFSTGQGVVLDRCVYSDFVFAETMYRHNYISKPAYLKYYEHRDNSLQELLRPHLVIYLDVPVPKILENIKKRNISYETNSPVLTESYLDTMERQYKQKYLKTIAEHAELLIYDWSVEGDTEIVVEDIEAIKFNEYAPDDPKMRDWYYEFEEDLAIFRYKYAVKKDEVMAYNNIPTYDCPELCISGEDAKQFFDVINSAPGQEYVHGYNQNMGDKGFLFKWSYPVRDTLPLIERRTS